jgi:SPP1 family predicted phage head-tail adaptor
MSAGRLRERVWFETRSVTDDGHGNVEGPWVRRFNVAAEIKPRLGSEAVLAARLSGVQPFTITVRGSSETREVTTDWRMVNYRTDVAYNIRAISNPGQKGKMLDFLVEEGVASG